MCGIAAIVSQKPDIADEPIERMTARLTHRGPEAGQSVKFDLCHLGHRRLCIIDLAGGNQPMSDAEGRFWIILNGEIFNYRELREELRHLGQSFRTASDTEVLLNGYRQYGEKVVDHLNGQFAFLIWDTVESKAFAARDRLGEKPLYWAETPGGQLLVASEIKSLLASGMIEPRLDLISVDAYLGLLYVPPDRTIYENVSTLRPGHAFSWEKGRMREWAYWVPRISGGEVFDSRELCEKLRYLISRAVTRQMVADVPVGAFLSGGLDSSTVVALMSQNAHRSIATFSVGFGDLINELPYARAVAERYGTEHHEIQMNIQVAEMAEVMAEVYDEPFADSSNIPTYLISEFARRHVKVVLAGDGADEIFGGYDWYSPLLASDQIESGAISRVLAGAASVASRVLSRRGLISRARRNAVVQRAARVTLKSRYPDFWERHLAGSTGIKSDRSGLWKRSGLAAENHLRSIYQPGPEVRELDRATTFDVQCYLPGDILVKVDRAAMAHGLETRAPFLDVDLVEFVLGLPYQLRFRDRRLKALLRESCQALWPETVRNRSKQGFGAPIWDWLARPQVRALVDRVGKEGHPLQAVLPGSRKALQGRDPQLAWTVLTLGLWLEKRTECIRNLP